MADLFENPLGTDGFEFVEYTGEPDKLDQLFRDFGFTPVAKHKKRDVVLYRQGGVNFLLNRETSGQAAAFQKIHTSGASAMGFRVKDAPKAYQDALKRGAEDAGNHGGSMGPAVPAIKGIGGCLIYFVDGPEKYMSDFEPLPGVDQNPKGVGFTYIDHLTHNLHRGNMDVWGKFYEDIFNFREIRYFDIEGKLTGLKSRAMTSPCGKIRIPLNESSDDKSQIAEFLKRYNGEGIQHIALGTNDIYKTVEMMAAQGVPFQKTPDTYYELLDKRVPGHGEDVDRLKSLQILMDGAPTEGQGLLLQIFTKDAIGPIFFEIIQRKGNEGFGEGNFKALFESIELDQIRRGVLKDEKVSA
ncbi:MAG: 4-hydroxyphenylpyruvate dioxygenase [Alphaproteobacteria bacterium]|nr:4-hydroxyphenylpyruvate dioxygenase [Alphaproteobacteria bacterium]